MLPFAFIDCFALGYNETAFEKANNEAIPVVVLLIMK